MPPRFKWRDPAEIYVPLAVKYAPNNFYRPTSSCGLA
jgi:hypothetical protein